MPSLSDLLRMGKQYISDALPGGSLNPEVSRQSVLDGAAMALSPVPLLGDLVGLGADANRYATDPESRTPMNYGLTALGALPFVPGMTAWHGSPHKFDKFSLDKIGTGEGAQAYGHGLYLAESPVVAKEYATKLSNVDSSGYANAQLNAQNLLQRFNGDKDWAREVVKDQLNVVDKADPNFSRLTATLDVLDGKSPQQLGSTGQLYKTDIPDEAVARFLDWDKPLSQQIEHLGKLSDAELYNLGITREGLDAFTGKQLTGGDLMRFSDNQHGGGFLNKKGIPGIRYLDGGSRSAGQGSSNFVVFDPEMIRILERNGIPTGQKPWSPNEYRPISDLLNPRID